MPSHRSVSAVIFLTVFIDMLGMGLIIPILPIFIKELGAENYQVGLIAMCFPLMNFVFAPVWGGLSDRYGRRPIMLVSIAVASLSYFIFANASSLIVVLLSRTMSGVGSANASVAQAYIADVTPPEKRTQAMGIIGAAFGLGFAIGPFIGGYLKHYCSPGQADLVGYAGMAFCLLNLISVYFLLPEPTSHVKSNEKFNVLPFFNLMPMLKRPIVREIFWLNFIYHAAFFVMQISASLFWKEQLHLGEQAIGNMFAFIGICVAIVQGAFVRPLKKRWGEMKLISYGIVISAIGLAMAPLANESTFFPLEHIAFALFALGNGCLGPALASLLCHVISPSETGKILGGYQSFTSAARATGMGISGLLYGVHYFVPFVFGSLLMLSCLVFYYIIARNEEANPQ